MEAGRKVTGVVERIAFEVDGHERAVASRRLQVKERTVRVLDGERGGPWREGFIGIGEVARRLDAAGEVRVRAPGSAD